MKMQLTERQLELINEAGKAYAAAYLLMTVAMDSITGRLSSWRSRL